MSNNNNSRYTQFKNPTTKHWQKRDNRTGLIVDVKEDGTPFANVPKERRS